jgi:transposase
VWSGAIGIRHKPRASVYGVDLGKNVFHVVGTDRAGSVVQRVKFRRDTLLAFFERAEPVLIGMEACPGSQWLARKLQAFGHKVRIIPAQFVKPYVKSNKNDTIDAAAIAEAVTRPTMRFVEVKQPVQVDIQAHRSRSDGRTPNEADLPDARVLPRVWDCDQTGCGSLQGGAPGDSVR